MTSSPGFGAELGGLRTLAAVGAVAVALVAQVTVFSHFSLAGIVPNLCLLVVVAAALTRGSQFAAVLGFGAGVALDLAPPADHIAGRWALALVVVGYVAGQIRQGGRQEDRPTTTTVVLTVAASSFVGTSVFALSGVVLDDAAVGVPELLRVIGISVLFDLLLTPFVLPPLMAMFRQPHPDRALA